MEHKMHTAQRNTHTPFSEPGQNITRPSIICKISLQYNFLIYAYILRVDPFPQFSLPKSRTQFHFLPSLRTSTIKHSTFKFYRRITFDQRYKPRKSPFYKFLQPPVSHPNSTRISSRKPALELPHSVFLLVYRITLYE